MQYFCSISSHHDCTFYYGHRHSSYCVPLQKSTGGLPWQQGSTVKHKSICCIINMDRVWFLLSVYIKTRFLWPDSALESGAVNLASDVLALCVPRRTGKHLKSALRIKSFQRLDVSNSRIYLRWPSWQAAGWHEKMVKMNNNDLSLDLKYTMYAGSVDAHPREHPRNFLLLQMLLR